MTDTFAVNGASNGADSVSYDTANIIQALQITHNPTTKNDVRFEALRYLEKLKERREALEYGFSLSTDLSQPPVVRHFGLGLLSHVIRHEAYHLSEEQNAQLRNCVLELGKSIVPSDLSFIRNKIAELWIELAKRSWALDWFDLDEQLVRLWSQELVHKDFVLTVLENLSEDIFVRDDSMAVLRGRDLNSAFVEIITSSSNYAGGIKIGDAVHHVRYGSEGWLTRIRQYLEECANNPDLAGAVKDTTIKALATLRSVFVWVMTPAVAQSMSLAVTCRFLTNSDPDLVMAAVDALLSLYGRTRLEELEVQALVYPLIQPEGIAGLSQLYSWSIVSVDEIDSSKYVVSKKLSELMSLLAVHTTRYAPPDPNTLDLSPFLHFMIAIAEHESLIVSIPVVHAWVQLLEVKTWRKAPVVSECIGPLLQVASRRLIQYDQLPEGTDDPVVAFVNDEIELFPERQGFYLSYRRLCSAVIEWICYAQLEEALQAVMNRADELLDEVQTAEQQLDPASYERVSMNVLRADSYFAMVDAALNGLDRWQAKHREGQTAEQEQLAARVRESAKRWLLNMSKKREFRDPQIRQRQIKTAVEASNRALQKDTGFAFSVLEHILSSFIITPPQHSLYAEAVTELHNYATSELRRLSLQHADYFVTFYDQLESRFTDLINQLGGDERIQIDLKSILFSIIQRAGAVDYAQRQAKLEGFLQSVAAAWADSSLQDTLQSLETFARSQAFDRVGPYMASIGAANVEDWSQVPYNERGVQIQRDMLMAFSKLPLRETRILLSISTDRLEQGSALHRMICDLWTPLIPNMLPHVLRLTSYNHQLHNPAAWPNVNTPELQALIRRVLRDRYWQSGISSGSMNEFHSKVKSTRSTIEGFASSVRGRIRNNLEQCYSILHTLGRLGPAFYSLQQLPEMMAEAAINTAAPLSPHHFSVMIQMLPKLIDECPPEHRQHFLTPILSSLLQQMDAKLTEEWVKMDERKQTKHEEENLNDEMRDDSVLRQTTYKAVNLVAHWLNPKREAQLRTKKSIVNGNYLNDESQQTMRQFVLSNVQILERLLVFVTHALAFRDTRSCYTMLGAVQRIVPEFGHGHGERLLSGDEAAAAREYISSEMLKTAITCLNDGYFADHQQHYAQLIATIWVSYGLPAHASGSESTTPAGARDLPPLTATPRNVILSLPGMTEEKVDRAAAQLAREGSVARPKKLRAIVLSLLEGVRGVRLSELGKIDLRPQQSKILEKYKQRESLGMQGVEDGVGGAAANGAADDGIDLGGVADMFAG
ncbi:karyopherin [Exophiala dermatitidis]|uniref:Uncharacterized protein n=2 Tax=Exophiala dermatitidis TaxID=5970 RepID=H6C4V2_EXODN|nr:uncharacterized protein HMPREF1120_06539 [Exophiala dermatitidis NIH/UT8656]KAJ4511058.1 karyopherin [Exophiala dermatitidis]EHY58529.1 hypothetical protein HMPREF1120_06539 [Exophiala dermatitidis NIH/UT8656]KAJ4512007.1 karyopherin [Exophiala dermatitidis]KAJ4534873.1 karyopherin [Exophiala dermatitidis]KAJ4550779.1 karyopherin [Exophiala dermatitidis]